MIWAEMFNCYSYGRDSLSPPMTNVPMGMDGSAWLWDQYLRIPTLLSITHGLFGAEMQDAPKFARVKELLAMNEELKRARKAFELDEDKLATEF